MNPLTSDDIIATQTSGHVLLGILHREVHLYERIYLFI